MANREPFESYAREDNTPIESYAREDNTTKSLNSLGDPAEIVVEEGVYANLESNSDTTSTNTKAGHILFQTSMPKEAVKFDTEKSRSFFDMETKTLGSGGRHLVAQSFYRGDRKPQDLEEEDVEICLQMTILVQSLSLRQNKLVGI